MQSTDFVYRQIYHGALNDGALERCAHTQAVIGLEKYKKNQFDKAINLINEHIKTAVKESKNERTPA